MCEAFDRLRLECSVCAGTYVLGADGTSSCGTLANVFAIPDLFECERAARLLFGLANVIRTPQAEVGAKPRGCHLINTTVHWNEDASGGMTAIASPLCTTDTMPPTMAPCALPSASVGVRRL